MFKTLNLRPNATSNNTQSPFAVVMTTNISKNRAGNTQKSDKPDSTQRPERRKKTRTRRRRTESSGESRIV